MGRHVTYAGVRPYLRHAIVATTAVLLLPVAGVLAFLVISSASPPEWLVFALGGVLAAIVSSIGTFVWARQPESVDLSFSELVIWGWLRRKWAEERAIEDAGQLGLDRSGSPLKRSRLSRARQLSILDDLASALESKDAYTAGHSQRVERHVRRTAEKLGLSTEEVNDLERAAAFHDVGKIRVPQRILRKPAALTPEERSLVQEHTQVGAWLVANVCSRRIVLGVRHHHERWDGRGYPDGLSGAAIPLYARIIAVADTYDAMTSTRPYRLAFDRRHAIGVLREEAGGQFDPEVVEAFLATLPSRTPVAVLFPLLESSEMLGRATASFRRARKAVQQPSVAAAGMAALLATSFFTMGPPALSTPTLPSQIYAAADPQPVVVADTHSLKAHSAALVATGEVAGSKSPTEDRVLGTRLRRGGGDAGGGGNPAPGAGGGNDGSTPNPPGGPADPGDGGGQPAPDNDDAAGGGGKKDKDKDGGGGGKKDKDKDKNPGDPNPEHGRDCTDHPGRGNGGGNAKHCD